jgi:hypothetical protein
MKANDLRDVRLIDRLVRDRLTEGVAKYMSESVTNLMTASY